MPIITYAELDSICIAVKAGNPHYSALSADWCTDLYYTGCRPMEIFELNRWTYDGISTYQLIPLKGNNPRLFDASVLTRPLKRAIAGDMNYYSKGTYSQAKNVFRTTTTYPQIYHETKAMDLYLFRYRYVKYLKLTGWTDEAIRDHMGWVELSMVSTYVDADLGYL